MRGVDPELLAAPNAYRIGLHPGGLLPRVREPAGWIAHLGHRLERALRWSGDPRLAALHREVRGYPGVAEVLDARPDPGAQELLLTVTLADPDGDLAFHSALTTFGGPHDVTLAELAVESFFPADAATRERLASLTAMTRDWRTDGVRVIPGDALDTNTPQTPGMHRAAAITHARAGAEKLWAGTVTIHPGARTGAHHHGELESVIYVVRGRARMRWGERLEFTAEAGPGGFIFVPPFVPHQEINAWTTPRWSACSPAAGRTRSWSTSTSRGSPTRSTCPGSTPLTPPDTPCSRGGRCRPPSRTGAPGSAASASGSSPASTPCAAGWPARCAGRSR